MKISAQEWQVIILVATACLIAVLSVIKNLNLKGVKNVIEKADKVVESVHTAMPQIPYLGVVDAILDFADTAVNAAEQNAKTGVIKPEERKRKAIDTVFSMLKAAEIELNPDQTALIDDAIQAVVGKLPKSNILSTKNDNRGAPDNPPDSTEESPSDTQQKGMKTMAKYRKLPVEIESFKLGFDPIPDWFMDAITSKVVTLHCDNEDVRGAFEECINTNCDIQTLEGIMHANNGDYIIKGVSGEIYPCKPDIFEKTYKLVEEGENNVK